MAKVGALHKNVRISRRFWRKLTSLMSIRANNTFELTTPHFQLLPMSMSKVDQS